MNCSGSQIYQNTNNFNINLDPIIKPLPSIQKNYTYTTQGVIEDHTIIDTYSNKFTNQIKCNTYIKYAPFHCPSFSSSCGNPLHDDYIMNKITTKNKNV